jgi:uncharacterized membrane protein
MVIDVANVFSQRRAMQKIADLSAISGAQLVDQTCSHPQADADGLAASNHLSVASGDQITVTCGRWDPARFAAPTYFSAGTPLFNAVHVTVAHNVPYFFAFGSRIVTAEATAKSTNIASFSLGTGAVSLNAGVINQVLNALLGTNLNLSGVAYTGLANSTISIGDLVTALNVGTVGNLLQTSMTAGQFLGWVAQVLAPTDPINADILRVLALQIPSNQLIRIGKTTNVAGILSVALANSESALSANVNVFDLLMTTAELEQVGHPAVTLASGINLPPVATTSVALAVIQAPVIAIGEAGQNAEGQWITSATSAQIRLMLNVSLLNVSSLGIPGLTGINLPLTLDVAPAVANLTKAQCASSLAGCEVDVQATPGIANLCLGAITTAMSTNPSAPLTCSQPAQLINIPGLLAVTAKVPIALTPASQSGQTFVFNGIADSPEATQSSSSNVGGVFENTASTLASQLTLNVQILGLGLPLGSVLQPLLTNFVDSALNPLLTQLDAVIVPLLHLLGVQVGYDTVHFISLDCGDTELIY